MRILFFVHKANRARQFDPVIRRLSERGHSVILAAFPKNGALEIPPRMDHPGVSVVNCRPRLRGDGWRHLIGPLRLARDYVRFFDPRFADATFVRRHAAERVAKELPGFKRFCDDHAWFGRCWRPVGWALGLVEDLVPSDRAFEAFIRSQRPDVILLTPLIDFGSYQTDYVKAAHALGLPVALLVFSWDNLTIRGLIRALPDRVLVWNETQKREAVELHGVPPERILVTGAPRFDPFFATKPSTTREEFCARAGLDPARPFVLYLCSADFVADQREIEFARRWAAAVRGTANPRLREVDILIRPHPSYAADWEEVDLSELDVAIWRRPRVPGLDPGLYDALYHAETVVGLNTTAMLEAGMLGKTVHTIIMPEFIGQEGTVHFDYLLRERGGLLVAARDLEQHVEQLAASLAAGGAERERTLSFLESFVRPYGLDVPVTPIMAHQIEQLAELRKRPRRRAPFWQAPLRRALLGWLDKRVVPAMLGEAALGPAPAGPTKRVPAAATKPAPNGAADRRRAVAVGAAEAEAARGPSVE